MGLEDFVSSGNERLDKQLTFTAEIDKMTSVLRRTVPVLEKAQGAAGKTMLNIPGISASWPCCFRNMLM